MRVLPVVLAVAACAPSPVVMDVDDGGTLPDAGAVDSGAPDAGAPDAGTPDAGPSPECTQRWLDLQTHLNTLNLARASSVAVASTDCPTYTAFHGPSVTADSLWREGSVTKTYVTATVVKMAGDGAFGLDDTLDTFSLPVPDAGTITVRQLLNHTSGIFNYTEDPLFGAMPQTLTTPGQLVAMATAHAPYFAPGAGWHYSNTNFILLGMLIEAKSGKPLHEALLPRPPHTFLDGEEPLGGTLVPGFSSGNQDVTNKYNPSWTWAAGGMVSTMAAQADWIQALYSGQVLNAAETASLSASPVGESYGLGTQIIPAGFSGGLGISLGHSGDIDGYHCMAFYFPVEGRTMAVAVDSDALDPNTLFADLMTQALK
jgi:D-alanyl-D-alanine carboxypeptidase